jgi:hypothetical protein
VFAIAYYLGRLLRKNDAIVKFKKIFGDKLDIGAADCGGGAHCMNRFHPLSVFAQAGERTSCARMAPGFQGTTGEQDFSL